MFYWNFFCFPDNPEFNAQVSAQISSCASQWHSPASLLHLQNLCLQRNPVHCSDSLSKWEGNMSPPAPHHSQLFLKSSCKNIQIFIRPLEQSSPVLSKDGLQISLCLPPLSPVIWRISGIILSAQDLFRSFKQTVLLPIYKPTELSVLRPL